MKSRDVRGTLIISPYTVRPARECTRIRLSRKGASRPPSRAENSSSHSYGIPRMLASNTG